MCFLEENIDIETITVILILMDHWKEHKDNKKKNPAYKQLIM